MCLRNIHGGIDNPNLVLTDWTLEMFQNVFNEEVLNQVTCINFCGDYGDPIINSNLLEMCQYASKKKSSLEILVEVFLQLIIMFCGIIVIHRIITYIPTYSGFKYDNLALTNVILAFLIIVLSIQTKLGLKVNILFDRVDELWNGSDTAKSNIKDSVRVKQPMSNMHPPSQADYLDNQPQGVFPPAPVSTNHAHGDNYDYMMRNGNGGAAAEYSPPAPVAANGVLGGAFGSFF
jgi:hypothetical protein